jgi:hypothetical protein
MTAPSIEITQENRTHYSVSMESTGCHRCVTMGPRIRLEQSDLRSLLEDTVAYYGLGSHSCKNGLIHNSDRE